MADSTSQPTAAAEPTSPPALAATSSPARSQPTSTPGPAVRSWLQSYANQHAGGPGAIYVGDLSQLVGPAPVPELGDDNGYVPLGSLQRHSYIYESAYYRGLLEKANLQDPTPLTSRGERIDIQYVCLDPYMFSCGLMESYFGPRVLERTNGQIRFETISFPELGLAGVDVIEHLSDGTIESAVVYSVYVSGQIPEMEAMTLSGVYSTTEESFVAAQAVVEDLARLLENEAGGNRIFGRSWHAGIDRFLFCRDPIDSDDDFRNKQIRTFSAPLSDWISEMGGRPEFVAFAMVYEALERGDLDCGTTVAHAAYRQRWYEVADSFMGPIYNIAAHNNIINADIWDSMPADLQQIALEEAAIMELEALRLASIQNEIGISRLQDAGINYVPFSRELQYLSRRAAIDAVIPGWLRRVGDTNARSITEIFNRRIGPIVGMRINSDGSVTDLRR